MLADAEHRGRAVVEPEGGGVGVDHHPNSADYKAAKAVRTTGRTRCWLPIPPVVGHTMGSKFHATLDSVHGGDVDTELQLKRRQAMRCHNLSCCRTIRRSFRLPGP